MITTKMSAAEHSVTIDGHHFDVPPERYKADGLREMIVNSWCHSHKLVPLYPDAPNGRARV